MTQKIPFFCIFSADVCKRIKCLPSARLQHLSNIMSGLHRAHSLFVCAIYVIIVNHAHIQKKIERKTPNLFKTLSWLLLTYILE